MLDIRTILTFMSISSLLMALTLWLTFASDLRDGLPKWIAAMILQAVCWAMFAAHGELPDVVGIWFANTLFALSWALKAASLWEFGGRPVPRVLPWGPTAIAALLFLFVLRQDFPLAPAAGGVYFALASGTIAWLLWRLPREPAHQAQRVLVGVYVLTTAGFLLRSYASAYLPATLPAPLAATPLQIVTYTLGYTLIVMSTLCLLLMHKGRSADAMRHLATVDPLTGACNRRTFMAMAEATLARARRDRSPVSLLMLDIDHFKEINDRHGHLVGDQVLQQFVAEVRACLRQEDMLTRYGGEEFCVLLPHSALDGARTLAERIRLRIANTPFSDRDDPVRLTASIGLSTTEDGQETSIDTLLESADCALYSAKNGGRDRVACIALDSWRREGWQAVSG